MSEAEQGEIFISSPAKDYIRDTFDFKIIETFRDENYPEQYLAYLGLTGERALDVISWRQFIYRWTAVQSVDTQQQIDAARRLVRRANQSRLDRNMHLIKGNIDDVLLDREQARAFKWPYQIVNLDYCGGLVNATLELNSHRIDAIRALFALQEGEAFVLFITLNLRDKDRGEYDRFLDEELVELSKTAENVYECFEEHKKDWGNAGKLKIYLPLLIGSMAVRHVIRFAPPILYKGGVQMIHFAFTCVPYAIGTSGNQFRNSNRIDCINQPLLLLHTGQDLRRYNLRKITLASSGAMTG